MSTNERSRRTASHPADAARTSSSSTEQNNRSDQSDVIDVALNDVDKLVKELKSLNIVAPQLRQQQLASAPSPQQQQVATTKKLTEMTEQAEDKGKLGDTESEMPAFGCNQTADPEKTREEIVAERRAKAEEKKRRAEAAKAKAATQKAGGEDPPKQQQAQKPKNNEKQQQQKKKERETDASADGVQKPRSSLKAQPSPAESHASPHAVVTGSGSGAPVSREVKFDLTSTMDSATIASEYDHVAQGSSTRAETPSPPIGNELETAHDAIRQLATVAENITELDSLAKNFLEAIKLLVHDHINVRADFIAFVEEQLSRVCGPTGRRRLPDTLVNILRSLKKELATTEGSLDDSQARTWIAQWLDEWTRQNVTLANDAISELAITKLMHKADRRSVRVLVYDFSPLVEHVLLNLVKADSPFEYCIVESGLTQSARNHVSSLVKAGANRVRFGALSALGALMPGCAAVLLGCNAILSTGDAEVTAGATQVALVARHFNVPVLVLAQTYKFVERVSAIGGSGTRRLALLDDRRQEPLPSSLITALVTDMRCVPPSSAPAVLKAKQLGV